MKEFDRENPANNKINLIKTFTVPIPTREISENLNFNAITSSEDSKEKLIKKAFMLHSQGKIVKAKKYYESLINQGINDHRVYSNYGGILKELGNFKDAEIAQRKAIAIKPEFANSHYNLSIILRDIGKIKEAEISIRRAIKLQPELAKSHSTLGSILIDLGKLKEAEISLRKAIKIDSNNITAYKNLCICLYLLKDKKASLAEIKNAQNIEPNNQDIMLLLNIINHELSINDTNIEIEKIRSSFFKKEKNLFISNRPVENKLIESLYKVNSRDANDDNKYQPIIVGNTRGSDFNLFDNNITDINKLKDELIDILKNNLKSNIFIKDSFVTIFKSGGGVKTHGHDNTFDRRMKCINRKLSLVYYISIGDQDCEDPGILKLYNPNTNILPKDGMIVVFPADRLHSASYSGKTDRIIVGINFYLI